MPSFWSCCEENTVAVSPYQGVTEMLSRSEISDILGMLFEADNSYLSQPSNMSNSFCNIKLWEVHNLKASVEASMVRLHIGYRQNASHMWERQITRAENALLPALSFKPAWHIALKPHPRCSQ